MPNLDGSSSPSRLLRSQADPSFARPGVSATSLIRQFDPMTPIISMTSNSGPNDIMTYFSHGQFLPLDPFVFSPWFLRARAGSVGRRTDIRVRHRRHE